LTRKRFRREDWLDLGLRALSEHDPEALKLEAICKAAGLTRGSFYHHFSDHAAYLRAVAEHWVGVQTQDLVAQLPETATAAEKDALLTELAIGLDFHLELGIRELARRDTGVAEVVRAADTARLSLLTELYVEKFGIGEEDATMTARLEYAAYIGTILTDTAISPEEQHRLAIRFQDMLAAYFGSEA